MKIALGSAAFPPDLDGIGDYTWWLAGAVAQSHETAVFTRVGNHRAQKNVTLHPVFDPADPGTVKRLPDALEQAGFSQAGNWLVFQYNPFSWGRRGWCPEVPRALREVKRRLPELGVAVMFHETTVPRWPWRFAIMRRWQRPVFRELCHLSDISFASSERYVRQIQKIGARAEVVHLPVGSNLAASPLARLEARRKLGLPLEVPLIGAFGSAHESRLLDWIAAAFRSLREKHADAKMLYVGPHGEAISRALGGREGLIDMGVQSAEDAGICIRAMDLLLSPFNDGISTRRGSAIAAFQNGVPVATTLTKWTDTIFTEGQPEGILLSPATTAVNFASETAEWSRFLEDPEARERVRPEVRAFHDRVFAWPVIAGKLCAGLERTAWHRPL
jgi:glycosyltransferase involved in cell wall biosynthesis